MDDRELAQRFDELRVYLLRLLELGGENVAGERKTESAGSRISEKEE